MIEVDKYEDIKLDNKIRKVETYFTYVISLGYNNIVSEIEAHYIDIGKSSKIEILKKTIDMYVIGYSEVKYYGLKGYGDSLIYYDHIACSNKIRAIREEEWYEDERYTIVILGKKYKKFSKLE